MGASLGRCHQVGRHTRRVFEMRSFSLTQGTRGLLHQACERFGLSRAIAFGFDGRGGPWYLSPSAEPSDMQYDKEPYDCQQSEL